MKIRICKKDNELVGKIIEIGDKEVDFSNLKMIDALYKNNDEVKLEFDGLSDNEKNKIVTFFDKIKQKVNELKTPNSDDSKMC